MCELFHTQNHHFLCAKHQEKEFLTFDEAIEYMSGLLRFGWKPGIARIRELCRLAGDPQKQYRIIHVTGTKGKGSTTAMAAAILRAHGFKTGSYFSPYVYDLCERVQVGGAPIGRDDLASLISQMAVESHAMPLGNRTGMTQAERNQLGAWIRQGAQIPAQ